MLLPLAGSHCEGPSPGCKKNKQVHKGKDIHIQQTYRPQVWGEASSKLFSKKINTYNYNIQLTAVCTETLWSISYTNNTRVCWPLHEYIKGTEWLPCHLYQTSGTIGTFKYTTLFTCSLPNSIIFQRKFAQESQEAKNDTFKKFRKWVEQNFTGGIPNEQEWQQIMELDEAFNYDQPIDQHVYVEQGIYSDVNSFDSNGDLMVNGDAVPIFSS